MRFSLHILALFIFGIGADLFAETLKHEKSVELKKPEIRCRCICDKKLSTEERMQEAIDFYKKSKNYKFATD